MLNLCKIRGFGIKKSGGKIRRFLVYLTKV